MSKSPIEMMNGEIFVNEKFSIRLVQSEAINGSQCLQKCSHISGVQCKRDSSHTYQINWQISAFYLNLTQQSELFRKELQNQEQYANLKTLLILFINRYYIIMNKSKHNS